jgi:hypothetical protein
MALTDDYAMSALTVATWGKPDQIWLNARLLRMTDAVEKVSTNLLWN